MKLDLPPELLEFVRTQTARSGKDSDEVLAEALRLYREVEERRRSLRESIREGMESGPSLPAEDVFQELYERAARR